jgi:hypothetical protein
MDPVLFTGAIDMIEYLDNIQPCPSFEGALEPWLENLDAQDEIELAVPEKDNLETYTDLIGEILNLFIQSATVSVARRDLNERVAHIQTLINRPNVAQRTPAWYEQSRHVLTASEFSVILGTPRAVGTLALQKTLPPRDSSSSGKACSTNEMGAMDWGVRFEPVVKQVLEKMWKASIIDIGRLVHLTEEKLAASPDGIIETAEDENRVGRLLEIKCPIRRVINNSVPFEYWCQMQIQMEVADIDECEYVEMKIVSPYKGDVEPYKAPENCEYSGTIWIVQDPSSCDLLYAYTQEELKDYEQRMFPIIETIPWHVDRYFNKIIQRDSAWFLGTAEKRSEFWRLVEETKAGTYVLPQSKRAKIVKEIVTVCKISDD